MAIGRKWWDGQYLKTEGVDPGVTSFVFNSKQRTFSRLWIVNATAQT
jgi:hypothetical protein